MHGSSSIVFLARLSFSAGDNFLPVSHHRFTQLRSRQLPCIEVRVSTISEGMPMPDSPAENNFAALKKMSLDPGTERMATKEELISLLESGEEPQVSPRISGHGATVAERSETARNQNIQNESCEQVPTRKEIAKSESSKK